MTEKELDEVTITGEEPQKEETAGAAEGDGEIEIMDAEEIAEAQEENSEEAEEAGTSGEDDEENDKESDDKKRKFFGKKKDKKDRLIDELNGKVTDLTDRVKRSMAEFDNYRKRTDKEKAAQFDMGERAVIEKILPVVDNFERGLATVPEENKNDAFVTGMDKIYQQLMKTLEDLGVTPIEAVGAPFDPNFHNAVMHIDDESLGENIVAEEFQKGYLHHGTVVRHSMVKVAN